MPTTMIAPMTGPYVRSTPPTITTSTNRIDWKNGKELGATNVVADAKNDPAIPASTADIVNATVRTVSGFTAIEAAAISESRTARIARPQAL